MTTRLLLPFVLATTLLAREPVLVDQAKLGTIHTAMEKAVEQKQAAGIVTLAIKDGQVIWQDAAGMKNIEKQQPMAKDSLFWIASMTKSISTTAIMTLVDEGKLSLDEPASKWLPELGKVKMMDGQPPKRPITLRDLMSHTAGIAFPPRKATDGAISLKAYTVELLKAPLAFEPGSAYEYGFGITIAGRIAEIISGNKFEQFMEERITGPLGMEDTTFHPTEEQRARIAMTYTLDDETKLLTPAYNPFVTGDASVKRMVEPSGGLFSTAGDMGRFYQMVADGGVWQGKRVVSEKSLAELTHAHEAGGKPISYGLGWFVNIDTARPAPMMPMGSFGHGGAFATNGWVVPQHKLITVFMVQDVLVPNASQPRDTFHRLVNEALDIPLPELPKKKTK
jgi:CubicO group peptidase (beta-lactamase class C family)